MSITETKIQIVEAIDLHDHLHSELNSPRDLDLHSEEEWQARLRNLGLETVKLLHTVRMLDNSHLIQVLKNKQKKIYRHGQWEKRHKKRTELKQKQLLKINEKWIKNAEWQVTMSPTSITTKPVTAEKKDKLKSKIKELSRILSKLTNLQTIRRKKLESKGHFFAGDGNEFFNKVKAWHEADAKKEKYEDIAEQKPNRKLRIDKADVWRHKRIDKSAYAYWCASDQSLDALLTNRRLWDHYIQDSDHDTIHQVPPTFVTPVPPANGIWASYLLPVNDI